LGLEKGPWQRLLVTHNGCLQFSATTTPIFLLFFLRLLMLLLQLAFSTNSAADEDDV